MNRTGNRSLKIIPGGFIRSLVQSEWRTVVSVVRDAYLAHDAGRTVNPQSVFLRIPGRPDARIIALPAHITGDESISGVKWISSYPANVAKGLPRAAAVLFLNESETGRPIACLEGSVISAARTAASAAIAAECIYGGGKTVPKFGIIGAGVISRYVVECLLATGWNLESIAVFDTAGVALCAFREWLANLSPATASRAEKSAASVLDSCAVALLATVAAEPHVHAVNCLSHHPTVLHLSLRDLSPDLIMGANNVVDDAEHVIHAGTSIARARMIHGHTRFITATLADVLLGRSALDPSRATIFSPFGLGMLDVALGRWVVHRAAQQASAVYTVEEFLPL